MNSSNNNHLIKSKYSNENLNMQILNLPHIEQQSIYRNSLANNHSLISQDPTQSQLAYVSNKNSQHVLIIDDIIPIQVNTPNIKISKKKRHKIEELIQRDSVVLMQEEVLSQSSARKSQSIEPPMEINQQRLNDQRQSLQIFKNRETYKSIENPESMAQDLQNYFQKKENNSLQKNQSFINRHVYHPPPQKSMTFGEYQHLRQSRLMEQPIEQAEDINRQSALKELRESRLLDRMIETQKRRNSIIQRIRVKSQLNQYNDSQDKHLNGSYERQQQDNQWIRQVKEELGGQQSQRIKYYHRNLRKKAKAIKQ
eukprot:403351790